MRIAGNRTAIVAAGTFRVIGVLLAAFLTLAGCDASSPAADKPQVALIMKSLANEFFSTMAAGAEAHNAANSDAYELIVNGIKDERDLSRQVGLVDEMVARGVDAIVIAPADSKALAPALRRATESGIVVVNIDNKLDDEVLRAEGLTIPFVGPDNRTGALKVGEHLAEGLAAGDQVVIVEGTRTSFNAVQRKLGFEDAMSAAGIEIVDSQTANWEMAPANTITASMLAEHPGVKAVLAANDSMALGAMAAVRAAGRTDEVAVVGFDNISAVQDAIREGQILATADQHADQLAAYGIDYALALLANPEQTLEDLETPVDLITLDVLDAAGD
jgi:ribose transport system substrate-binding protein